MKILIVDDHPLFRAGFHAVLEQSTLEAGVLSVSSVTEALQTLQRDPDIGLVLLDVHLRGGDDGFNALKVIGQKFPTTACIMISGDEQHGVAARAVSAGASGFIPKSFTADEMIVAIQKVLAGDVFVPATADLSGTADTNGLTLRQLEVISMLGRGFSNKEIARALDVAERTVKAHVSAVFEALNVRNRTQAVLVAQRRGFLPTMPAGLPPSNTPAYANAR
jgi:DNA-binding NarL/FixJ family response regulator